MEAQRYPADYDGILAGAPAINWTKLHVAQLWGQLVMLEADHFTPACKFEAAAAAGIKACDEIDGVQDELNQDPSRCAYDPSDWSATRQLTAARSPKPTPTSFARSGKDRDARTGSFLWYGLARGAEFRGLYNTKEGEGVPFRTMLRWFQYFLTQDPDWDWTTITPESYEQFWDRSNEQFGMVIGTDNPDLSAFRERGGKAIVWHGWSDQLIYAQGTIDYYERVREEMGEETSRVHSVVHGSWSRPLPWRDRASASRHFGALMDWVEAGHAPDSIRSVRLNGSGDVDAIAACVPVPDGPEIQGRRQHG